MISRGFWSALILFVSFSMQKICFLRALSVCANCLFPALNNFLIQSFFKRFDIRRSNDRGLCALRNRLFRVLCVGVILGEESWGRRACNSWRWHKLRKIVLSHKRVTHYLIKRKSWLGLRSKKILDQISSLRIYNYMFRKCIIIHFDSFVGWFNIRCLKRRSTN